MKSEILKFSSPLDETSAMNVVRVLKALGGVKNVTVAADNRDAEVQFDDDCTSLLELVAVLKRAGFDVKKPVHGEDGVCCGSCS